MNKVFLNICSIPFRSYKRSLVCNVNHFAFIRLREKKDIEQLISTSEKFKRISFSSGKTKKKKKNINPQSLISPAKTKKMIPYVVKNSIKLNCNYNCMSSLNY